MILVNFQAKEPLLKFHRQGPVTTLTNSWEKAMLPVHMPTSGYLGDSQRTCERQVGEGQECTGKALKRHTRAAPRSANTHCGADVTGGLPSRRHVGRHVPGGGTVLVYEGCILHCCSTREATGVVHVFCSL